jgi:hypothetical protein
MPLPKNAQNDRARIDDRRAKVAALYLAGKSQQAIAGVVGVSQMTVSKDIAHLRAQWRAAACDDFGAKQAEELAKLASLERAAWEGWIRSCEDARPHGRRWCWRTRKTFSQCARSVRRERPLLSFPSR